MVNLSCYFSKQYLWPIFVANICGQYLWPISPKLTSNSNAGNWEMAWEIEAVGLVPRPPGMGLTLNTLKCYL